MITNTAILIIYNNSKESNSEVKSKNNNERKREIKDKIINDNERVRENAVYINVRVSHNNITSIKNDRICKNDDNKNFKNIVYIDERGSTKYKIIKNVDIIRKSKDSEYRRIDIENIRCRSVRWRYCSDSPWLDK